MSARPARILAMSLAALTLMAAVPSLALAQRNKFNFPDRRAHVVNANPHIALSQFKYENVYATGGIRFNQDLRWKNIGTQPVVAFEVVVLKYDPFNRRMLGSRWMVSGKNSADWSPLAPGAEDGDGTRGLGDEEVYTAIAYVRHVRLADGTIWTANDAELLAELRKIAPDIKAFGDVKPDPKTQASGSSQ